MAIFRGYGTFFSELLDYNYSYRYWLNPLTYFIGKQHKKKKCGLGAKFGPNYVQHCKKSRETGIINSFSFHILHGDIF